MGQMKAYQMWLEEKGYVEVVQASDGSWDYQNSKAHPGESAACDEYLEERDAG
jgi:hypothetical protein|tara:strand:+ start:399 stop:557 length:159 start_codon:yes stop_codon:yes gene_type:complete